MSTARRRTDVLMIAHQKVNELLQGGVPKTRAESIKAAISEGKK
jgi:hypothetical protein